jgi:hypothetical protein
VKILLNTSTGTKQWRHLAYIHSGGIHPVATRGNHLPILHHHTSSSREGISNHRAMKVIPVGIRNRLPKMKRSKSLPYRHLEVVQRESCLHKSPQGKHRRECNSLFCERSGSNTCSSASSINAVASIHRTGEVGNRSASQAGWAAMRRWRLAWRGFRASVEPAPLILA